MLSEIVVLLLFPNQCVPGGILERQVLEDAMAGLEADARPVEHATVKVEARGLFEAPRVRGEFRHASSHVGILVARTLGIVEGDFVDAMRALLAGSIHGPELADDRVSDVPPHLASLLNIRCPNQIGDFASHTLDALGVNELAARTAQQLRDTINVWTRIQQRAMMQCVASRELVCAPANFEPLTLYSVGSATHDDVVPVVDLDLQVLVIWKHGGKALFELMGRESPHNHLGVGAPFEGFRVGHDHRVIEVAGVMEYRPAPAAPADKVDRDLIMQIIHKARAGSGWRTQLLPCRGVGRFLCHFQLFFRHESLLEPFQVRFQPWILVAPDDDARSVRVEQ